MIVKYTLNWNGGGGGGGDGSTIKKTTRGISLTQMTISDKMIDTKAFIQSRSNSHSRGLSHNIRSIRDVEEIHL